jgi:4-hydroxy-tetrahydrodipicolinate synthase
MTIIRHTMAGALPAHQFNRAVVAPILTPFNADLLPDTALFVAHGKRLLNDGCAALAPFGTTGEANSLSMPERMALLEALIGSGVPANRLIPGTGLTSMADTATLCRHACDLGVAAVMVLPPFYYKNVSDEGLYRYFAQLIEGIASTGPRIYLYHIPQVAGTGFSLSLVKRLARDFPEIVVGIKDSSGSWDNTEALLHGVANFTVFPGNELRLVRAMKAGAAGCITATANINALAIANLAAGFGGPDAEVQEAVVDRFRLILQEAGPIMAMKALLAADDNHPNWALVRPPLQGLTPEVIAQLRERISSFKTTER